MLLKIHDHKNSVYVVADYNCWNWYTKKEKGAQI